MKHDQDIEEAVACVQRGGVIAYPTEAVYGFGCDPLRRDAVLRILELKHRSMQKGLILIASEWKQLESFVEPVDPQSLARAFASWPGSVTWVFPASAEVPPWIRGGHTTVAIRITQHPIAKALCQHFGRALVSTSANREGDLPYRDARALQMAFGKAVDKIVVGAVGSALRPTEIRDVITGEILREG